MIRTSRRHQGCHDLFTRYPLAARAVSGSGTIHSMVLLLPHGDDARFFVLVRDRGQDRPSYSLYPWRAPGAVGIGVDGGAVPEAAANVVTRGIPIPRDGSMFGWIRGETVTALIVIHARYTRESPVPTWSVMPLTDVPETQWPPFICESLFGQWFWEHYREGKVIFLGGVIAANPHTVFWVDTRAILGSDSCVVAHDLKSPEGYMLRRGRYVYSEVLRAGKPVPSLTALLATVGKIDLTPRFEQFAPSHG